jgi:hypothetical protein
MANPDSCAVKNEVDNPITTTIPNRCRKILRVEFLTIERIANEKQKQHGMKCTAEDKEISSTLCCNAKNLWKSLKVCNMNGFGSETKKEARKLPFFEESCLQPHFETSTVLQLMVTIDVNNVMTPSRNVA